MKSVTHRTKRRLRIPATGLAVLALVLGITGAESTHASPVDRSCPTAEIFATDNTAIITDPDDPRLRTRLTRFDHEVRAIIRAHGARPAASTLLDGVFWSEAGQQATYERSREFDVNRVGRDGLHHIAGVIAKEYDQEAVLTFRCLPRTSPETDAVEIEVPGVRASRLRARRWSRTPRPGRSSAAARSPSTDGSSSSPRSPICPWRDSSRSRSAPTGTRLRCTTATGSS